MTYKVYPKGYDPMVASGPPTKDIQKLGVMWTEKETKKAKKLENRTKIIVQDHEPKDAWFELVPE